MAARVEQTEKMQVSEEEKKLINKELECLKRELNEKAQELSNERLKVENLIRNEQVLILKKWPLIKYPIFLLIELLFEEYKTKTRVNLGIVG